MARDFAIRNQEKLLENMVLIRDLLGKHNLKCFLHYGTLLGAIREKGFIPHDDDADMGVFDRDFDALLNLIPQFLDLGFSFESLRHGRLLQCIRDGEQVDLFVAVPTHSLFGNRWWIDERVSIKGSFLNSLDTISFLGTDFLIPLHPEKLLRFLYGKTWRIPMKNIPSKTGIGWKIKKILHEPHKLFYFITRFIKTQKIKNRG